MRGLGRRRSPSPPLRTCVPSDEEFHSEKDLPSSARRALPGRCAERAGLLVSADIATSTTWTKNNVYRLQQQIYVLPGATLTIEAGNRHRKHRRGRRKPRGLPRRADLRERHPAGADHLHDDQRHGDVGRRQPEDRDVANACNEWGNLTLMGGAFISENVFVANTAFPNGANYGEMEGLVAGGPTDTRIRYGGGDDYHSSGSLSVRLAALRRQGRLAEQRAQRPLARRRRPRHRRSTTSRS